MRAIVSTAFSSGHSLRFPRIVGLRLDKSPRAATTLQELQSVLEANKGQFRKQHAGASSNGACFLVLRLDEWEKCGVTWKGQQYRKQYMKHHGVHVA